MRLRRAPKPINDSGCSSTFGSSFTSGFGSSFTSGFGSSFGSSLTSGAFSASLTTSLTFTTSTTFSWTTTFSSSEDFSNSMLYLVNVARTERTVKARRATAKTINPYGQTPWIAPLDAPPANSKINARKKTKPITATNPATTPGTRSFFPFLHR